MSECVENSLSAAALLLMNRELDFAAVQGQQYPSTLARHPTSIRSFKPPRPTAASQAPRLPPMSGGAASSDDRPQRRKPARRHHARPPAGRHALPATRSPSAESDFRGGGNAANPMALESPFAFNEAWTWQLLPDSILYKSYLAGNHESRFGTQLVHIDNLGNIWDATLGGRAGILRYGNSDPYWPEGYQLDIEGAAFPRLDLRFPSAISNRSISASASPSPCAAAAWQTKFGYYHFSSHLGDEYMRAQQLARPAELRARNEPDVRPGRVLESEFPTL